MRDSVPKPAPVQHASPSAALPPAEFPGGMRVVDKVVAAFNHACALGDLDAAEDVLAALERITERRIRRFGGDRRQDVFTVNHAREHLGWLKSRRPG